MAGNKSKLERKLEERVSTLEKQIKEVAKVATGCAAFVNALIKHTGITNEKLQIALVEAGLSNAQSQFVRPTDIGAAGDHRRNGNSDVSGGTSDRTDSGSSAPTAGQQAERADETRQTQERRLDSGDGSTSSSGGTGIQAGETPGDAQTSNGQP